MTAGFAAMVRTLSVGAAPGRVAEATLSARAAGRPPGDVSRALLSAAASTPGTVHELAERACVGYAAARYTSSRLVSRGELVPVREGRPRVLAVPVALRSFWEEVDV